MQTPSVLDVRRNGLIENGNSSRRDAGKAAGWAGGAGDDE